MSTSQTNLARAECSVVFWKSQHEKLKTENANLKSRTDALEAALRNALKLPRPWLKPSTITFDEWESVFVQIEAALAEADRRKAEGK